MIPEPNQQHDEWTSCPPGTLRRMMGEVHQARRRALMRRFTSVLAVACLLGAGAWLGAQAFVFSRPAADPQEFVTLRCSEVRELLVQYGHGALADKVRERVSAHLRECPHCRSQHLRIQAEQAKKQTSWLATKSPVKI
jgi:anti-sigma factor RsiW